jgi:peptidoglycan/xylan/chitin deacetylase (PgdA/CDA1 family)
MQTRGPGWRKRVATAVAEGAESSGVLAWLDRAPGDSPRLLRVLTYHRIDEPRADPEPCPSLLSATPADFALQMDYLSEHYQIVSVERVLDTVRGGAPLPPRALLLTFDDAYRDFAEHAWPVLRERGLPATLFVPTAYPDAPERAFWWDRIHQALGRSRAQSVDCDGRVLPLRNRTDRSAAYVALREEIKRLPHDVAMGFVDAVCAELGAEASPNLVLSWNELRGLAREGVTLGAHTQTHPLLHRLPSDRVRSEAVGSLEDLRREIGKALPIFAYPSGGFDALAVAELARAGFELAFTTRRGINDLGRLQPLLLRRTSVVHRASEALLRAQLLSVARGVQRFIA